MAYPVPVKDRQFVDVCFFGYLSTVHDTTSGLRGKQLYFCSVGRQVSADRGSYMPVLAAFNDAVADWSGDSRCSLTFLANRPVVVYDSIGGTYVFCRSFYEAIQRYPGFTSRANVYLYAEIIGADGDISGAVDYPILTGTVRCPAQISGQTVTLEVESVDAFALNELPVSIIDEQLLAVNAAMVPFDESKGVVGCLALGEYKSPLVDLVQLSERDARLVGALGLRMPLSNVVSGGTYGASGQVNLSMACEPVFTAGVEFSSVAYRGSAYVRIGDTLARLYSGWQNSGDPLGWHSGEDGLVMPIASNLWVANQTRYPWVQYPIVPKPIGAYAAQGEAAVDGNPLTYATIGPGQSFEFELPTISQRPGRLGVNNTIAGTGAKDTDGQYAPPGLMVAVLLINPPGGDAPESNQKCAVKFAFPDGTAWRGFSMLVSVPTATYPRYTLDEDVLVCDDGVNVPGSAGAGWLGSKFHMFDFTTCPTAPQPDGSVADGALYNSGVLNQGVRPFRIVITNNGTTKKAYVAAVALIAGVRMGEEPRVNVVIKRFQRESTYHTPDGRAHKRKTWTYASADDVKLYQAIGTLPGLWAGNIGTLIPYKNPYLGDPPRSPIFACAPTVVDTSIGGYTGTPYGSLREPHHFARMILKLYGGVSTTDEPASTSFGSYSNINKVMHSWWTGANVADNGFHMDLSVSSKRPIRQIVDDLGVHALDMQVRRMPDGKYGYWCWGPAQLLVANAMAYTSGIGDGTKINVMRQLVAGPNGVQVTFDDLDYSNVINDIEVRYGDGLYNVAKCNRDGSDDGTGAAWGYGGLVPFRPSGSSLTAQELCQWSAGMFGRRQKCTIELPNVHKPRVAVMIGLYHLLRKYRPEVYMTFIGNAGLCDLWPGMVFRIDNEFSALNDAWVAKWAAYGASANWADYYWQVTQSEVRQTQAGMHQAVRAVMVPWDFGQEVGGGALFGFVGDDPEVEVLPS